MRLIDADTLKNTLKSNCDTLCPDKNTNWCEHCCPLNDFEDLIDNAPTVEQEVYITGEDYNLYMRGYNQARKDFERPQGEWGKHGECPFCSYIRKWENDNFCGNCGADMRGGAE